MYEWLGVDKTELAVMAELLLRGEQTVGELRARASRMEPIAGLAELKPILNSLIAKNLVISLTPEGRGQVVTHCLYPEKDLEQVKQRVSQTASEPAGTGGGSGPQGEPAPRGSGLTSAWSYVSRDAFDGLRAEVSELQDAVRQLRDRLDKIEQLLQ
jgi:hypothetical protein